MLYVCINMDSIIHCMYVCITHFSRKWGFELPKYTSVLKKFQYLNTTGIRDRESNLIAFNQQDLDEALVNECIHLKAYL